MSIISCVRLLEISKERIEESVKKISQTCKSKITDKVEKIAKEAFSKPLNETTAALKKAYSIAEREVSTLHHRRTKSDVDPLLITTLALQNAPTQEAYFQVLAQNASYLSFANGTALPRSQYLVDNGFIVQKTVQFPCGLKALIITSEQPDVAPLMVFRGTDPTNIHNLVDDCNQAIGELNCKRYERELENELETVATNHGRIHIMGHSYGGAVAEHLTSHYPQLIQRCTAYNAPGCGKKAIERFTERLASLPEGYPRPQIVSYRHAKDIVSLLGNGHLPADPNHNFTFGSENDGISHIEAHSFNSLSVQNVPVVANGRSSQGFANFAATLEKARKQLSCAIPLYKLLTH